VTESTTDITPGALLWGFWPTASTPVSLRLQPSEVKGHWTETSESRQRLMTIYNAYVEEGRIDLPEFVTKPNINISSLVNEDVLKHMSWISLFRPTWSTGYLLSRHTFTSSPASRPPIHPLGMNLPWTAADADISAAVVISLSASSKTARSFAYHVFRRSAGEEGPVGFLQVSQTPEVLEPVAGKLGTKIPAKAVRYDQVGESVEWIGGLRPERIVLVDFGARAGTLAQLAESIKGHSVLRDVKTTIVQVGSEQKVSDRKINKPTTKNTRGRILRHHLHEQVYSADDIKENRESMQKIGKIQFNTSGVRDSAVELTSAQDYYGHVQPVWEDWMRISHEITPDIQITLGRGVSGDDGIEKGWSRLCQGSVGTQEGLVYTM
jgi:hypothetical protein